MSNIDMEKWDELVLKISKQFNVIAEDDFILFLIGIQEKGCGFQKFERQEKMDLINLAKCRLLRIKGLTTETGIDKDGWPLFDKKEALTKLEDVQINAILKEAMLEYFEKSDYLNN